MSDSMERNTMARPEITRENLGNADRVTDVNEQLPVIVTFKDVMRLFGSRASARQFVAWAEEHGMRKKGRGRWLREELLEKLRNYDTKND